MHLLLDHVCSELHCVLEELSELAQEAAGDAAFGKHDVDGVFELPHGFAEDSGCVVSRHGGFADDCTGGGGVMLDVMPHDMVGHAEFPSCLTDCPLAFENHTCDPCSIGT